MDWQAIRNTVERYMFGVDARDLDTLTGCFTPDATAIYHRGTEDERTTSGGAAIARQVFDSCSRFTASNHGISSFVATVEGDRAAANTFAVAHVIVGDTGLMRGLRYEDSLIRQPDGWRICRRVHTPLWQSAIAVTRPKFF